jgi:hypothetical protein
VNVPPCLKPPAEKTTVRQDEARADNRGVLLSAQRHDGALVFSRRASHSGRWSHLDRDFGEPTNRPLVILSHRVGAALITSICDSRKRRR